MENSTALQVMDSASLEREDFLEDVISGLGGARKSLDPKYFYDERGSHLFERITKLPEYYITRTETRLMEQINNDLASHCDAARAIVEFGSGSGRRSELLLTALPGVDSYVPIDVSEELLASTARVVERTHPGIRVIPLVADFTGRMQLPAATPQNCLGYFPGSTIGNFLPGDAVSFLKNARSLLAHNAQMLVGVDLVKDFDTLEHAYDDDAGVTSEFNKNILERINRELDADFDLDKFGHQAFFDENRSRIEMHLVSLTRQTVSIDGDYRVEFSAGESIHTENSHKYTTEGFQQLAQQAGWQCATHWMDDTGLFSIHLLETR